MSIAGFLKKIAYDCVVNLDYDNIRYDVENIMSNGGVLKIDRI